MLKKNRAEALVIHGAERAKAAEENTGREYVRYVKRYLEEKGLRGEEKALVEKRLRRYFEEGGLIE